MISIGVPCRRIMGICECVVVMVVVDYLISGILPFPKLDIRNNSCVPNSNAHFRRDNEEARSFYTLRQDNKRANEKT